MTLLSYSPIPCLKGNPYVEIRRSSDQNRFVAMHVPNACGVDACHFVIDDLKARVPIWKREIYSDGSIWKENAEGRAINDV